MSAYTVRTPTQMTSSMLKTNEYFLLQFQMVQAIQVLRFHLLELEKVSIVIR